MQSPRLATVKTLTQVLRVPEIEVADLRAAPAIRTSELWVSPLTASHRVPPLLSCHRELEAGR